MKLIRKLSRQTPNIKKKEKACYDGRWMVDGGGWWMVEKKVLRFLSKLAHLYFKINKCAKFSTDLFWFTKFFIMTDGGRKRKGNTNAGLQPQKIVKLSQFQAISTGKYYTQVFWKDYLAFPVCSRLNFRHGVPGVLRQLVLNV